MKLAAEVLDLARSRELMIATAESCTGGMIAAALTDVPGSSDVVDRGFVTYSNAAKQQMLGVDAATLADVGAVSQEVAEAMARGAIERSDAGLAVAVTGIAGPGGGTAHKPEGLVWFGLATPRASWSFKREFGAIGRGAVRRETVEIALEALRETLAD